MHSSHGNNPNDQRVSRLTNRLEESLVPFPKLFDVRKVRELYMHNGIKAD